MRSQWEQLAWHYSPNLSMRVEELINAFDIVYNALGSAWIAEQEEKEALSDRSPSDRHALYRESTSQAPTSLATFFAVARYLRAFKSDPEPSQLQQRDEHDPRQIRPDRQRRRPRAFMR